MTMREAAAELAAVAARMEDETLAPVVESISRARRIMLYGCGPSGAGVSACSEG